MLVLSRRIGEKILVPECQVTVTILDIVGSRVRLGISAPDDVEIYREEIWQDIRPAARTALPAKG
jgi:carbon storage regulator